MALFIYKWSFHYHVLKTGPSNWLSLAIHKYKQPFLYDTVLILFFHLYVDYSKQFLLLVCSRQNSIQILIVRCVFPVQTFSPSLI